MKPQRRSKPPEQSRVRIITINNGLKVIIRDPGKP